jgi:hypothetical protein
MTESIPHRGHIAVVPTSLISSIHFDWEGRETVEAAA